MTTVVDKNTFSERYADDFNDSAGFHKVLFNSGRALQQRELNQLQTIIQKEISSFANFVFKQDGGKATGPAPNCNIRQFVKIDTSAAATANIPADVQELKGLIFEEADTGIEFSVSAVAAATATDPLTLYFTTINPNDTSVTARVSQVTISSAVTPKNLVSGAITLVPQATNTITNPRFGEGVIFSIDPSRYYVREHFVFTRKQDLIVSKYNTAFEGSVGFIVTEQIVTVNDDQSLYDNSGAQLNLAAPGADRFQILLDLVRKVDVTDEFYVELALIKNGQIQFDRTQSSSNLGDIKRSIVDRTFETNGNFAVSNFLVDFKTFVDSEGSLDSDKLTVVVDAGTAYVEGTRYNALASVDLDLLKPRSTKILNNRAAPVVYGNYFVVDSLVGVPDVNNFGLVFINNGTGLGGSTIGRARVRAIENFGANYKLYLFDVRMNVGSNLSTARSVGVSATNYANIKLEPTGVAELKDKIDNNLFFPLPINRPKTVSANNDITLTTQKIFTATPTGDTITLVADANHVFDDASGWIVTRNDTGAVVTVSPNISGSTTATISGLAYSGAHTIAAYQQKTGVVRPKTLTNRIQTGLSAASDGTVTLDKGDIFQIDSARDESTDLRIDNRYILDNGQRDNFYGMGKLVLKGGSSAPAGNVKVAYKYFDHNTGGAGDFFAVNSYNTSEVPYENIPSFRQQDGSTIELRDHLDFRPLRNSADSDFENVHKLPRVGDNVTFDEEVYLGYKGRIFVHKDNYARVITGISDINPPMPEGNLPGMMEIANFEIYPYMLNDEDMSLTYIDNKRYTMRDIGRLDRRLGELEELTSLTLLELETNSIDVFDSNGNNRFKSGITADKFRNHAFSDTQLDDYRASIDPIKNELRPEHHTEAVDLIFDSGENVSVFGDLVMLNHDTELYIEQTSASRSIEVNPIQLKNIVGFAKLSPSSDTWIDTKRLPKRVIKGDPTFDLSNTKTFNNWDFNFSGVSTEQLENYKSGNVIGERDVLGNTYKQGYKTYQAKTTQQYYVSNISTRETLKGDFLLNQYSLTFARSRFISFRLTGLRPNTRYFAFMDGKNISNFVNSSSGTSAYEPKASLVKGSPFLETRVHKDKTSFPTELGGTTAILTDSNGAASGYIMIPNNDTLSFKSGDVLIHFLDISQFNIPAATSYAVASYSSAGVLKEYEKTYISTRHVEVVGKTKAADPVFIREDRPSNFGFGGDGGDGGDGGGGGFGGASDNDCSEADMGNDACEGGGDGGGSGGKIVCTAMNYTFGIGNFRNAIWIKYAMQNHKHPAWELGYHKLFLSTANNIIKNPNSLRSRFIMMAARYRTLNLRKELRNEKTSMLFKLAKTLLRPIIFVTGILIMKNILKPACFKKFKGKSLEDKK